jgi:hypothetical protein
MGCVDSKERMPVQAGEKISGEKEGDMAKK